MPCDVLHVAMFLVDIDMDVESETINLVNFDACKLQSYPDSPGAGGAEVRVKLRPAHHN